MFDKDRILCAIDLSEGSGKVVDAAATLANKLHCGLEIVHVFDHPLYNLPTGFTPTAAYSAALVEADRDIRKQLEERLAQAGQAAAAREVPVTTQILEGPAAQTIIDQAKTDEFSVVVVGTHGYSGIKHVLLGSVAERVVRLAQCPVLTVPTSDPE